MIIHIVYIWLSIFFIFDYIALFVYVYMFSLISYKYGFLNFIINKDHQCYLLIDLLHTYIVLRSRIDLFNYIYQSSLDASIINFICYYLYCLLPKICSKLSIINFVTWYDFVAYIKSNYEAFYDLIRHGAKQMAILFASIFVNFCCGRILSTKKSIRNIKET